MFIRGVKNIQGGFTVRDIIGEAEYTKLMSKLHGYKCYPTRD